MKFRDMEIDDVLVVGPLLKEEFLKELKQVHQTYNVIDLQYAVIEGTVDEGHSALVLVRNKK